jgi:hypothetical protein
VLRHGRNLSTTLSGRAVILRSPRVHVKVPGAPCGARRFIWADGSRALRVGSSICCSTVDRPDERHLRFLVVKALATGHRPSGVARWAASPNHVIRPAGGEILAMTHMSRSSSRRLPPPAMTDDPRR